MIGSIRLAGALLSATLIAASAWCQNVASADLRVTIRDPDGALISGATVTVRDDARKLERSNTSGSNGECLFLSLPPDEYTISVRAESFALAEVTNVRLKIGEVAKLPIQLAVASVTDNVTVTGDPGVVETQRSASATTVVQQNITNLPINGRQYINFALMDSKLTRDSSPVVGAAPTSGISFSGQRPRSNLVNVDGTDAVDNTTNGVRSTVSQESVQEFQIQTNNFAAEYGRASGGVINIVTKSGTDETHGSAFGYLRNRKLQDVNPLSTEPDPAYTRVQTGLSLGGPLPKHKAFYFFSYEATRRRETAFSTIGSDNFGLVSYDTAPLAPLLELGGESYGTVLLTPEQASFVSELVAKFNSLSVAQRNALAPVVQRFMSPYLALAAGGSGVALNGKLPSPAMINVVAGLAARLSLPAPAGLTVFPTSGAMLPESFVPLESLLGNYPVTEATDIYSLRFDQRFSNDQSGALRIGFSPSFLTGIQNTQTAANLGQSSQSRSADQRYSDWTVAAQHTWVVAANNVNEFRFQYAYRGLRYLNSSSEGGSNPGINIAGYAFFGREPVSYVDRTEERYQFADNFTIAKGRHTIKTGTDVHILPLSGLYTIQFGGLYMVGSLRAGALMADERGNALDQLDLSAFGLGRVTVPGFNPVQAYGLGVPQSFTQGVGNPSEHFTNRVFAGFVQDSWRMRPNLTVNYGVRYDVELTPEFKAINAMSQAAERAMGITQGIPRDYNNFSPRLGVAWDPRATGTDVVRASYGIFFDHPLMAMAFDSDVADGAQAPLVVLFGGTPGCGPNNRNLLNATNAFQGLLSCLPPAFNYVPAEQRFNAAPNAPSIFTGQQYLAEGVPLLMLPFSMPVGRDFQYGYSNQASLSVEHAFGANFALGLEYSFNGGRHLNRPNERTNGIRSDLLKVNYDRALAAIDSLAAAGVPSGVLNQLRPADPLSVSICPAMLQSLGLPTLWASSNFAPAPLVSFFRPSGLNPSLTGRASPFAVCAGDATSTLQEFGLGVGVPVPFSGLPANFSDGTSSYHGLTANFRKRMSAHHEFLLSYTWSHAIDDGSTDLQGGVGPQDSYHPERERADSLFDQRHRIVFSSAFQTGKVFKKGIARLLSDWTLAPIIEVSSGRPFNIVTYTDRNFDFNASTDRPMVVPAGTAPNACGDPSVPSRFSPTGFFQLACYRDPTPTFTGNLKRNAGVKPWSLFNDVRISRRVQLSEGLTLDAILDMFNVINRPNVADVNPLYTSAGVPTAAFDPRQFQVAIRMTW